MDKATVERLLKTDCPQLILINYYMCNAIQELPVGGLLNVIKELINDPLADEIFMIQILKYHEFFIDDYYKIGPVNVVKMITHLNLLFGQKFIDLAKILCQDFVMQPTFTWNCHCIFNIPISQENKHLICQSIRVTDVNLASLDKFDQVLKFMDKLIITDKIECLLSTYDEYNDILFKRITFNVAMAAFATFLSSNKKRLDRYSTMSINKVINKFFKNLPIVDIAEFCYNNKSWIDNAYMEHYIDKETVLSVYKKKREQQN